MKVKSILFKTTATYTEIVDRDHIKIATIDYMVNDDIKDEKTYCSRVTVPEEIMNMEVHNIFPYGIAKIQITVK